MSFATLASTVPGQTVGVSLLANPVHWEMPSFQEQVDAMPAGYRSRVGNIAADAASFYETALEMNEPCGDLDALPRAYIQQVYSHVVRGHTLEPNSLFPDYYYGYIRTSSDVPSALRMVGLIPPNPEEIIGSVVNIPGYSHGFERDQHRIRLLLDAGFAVFTPERVEHGLSSPVDPRVKSHRNAELLSSHLHDQIKTIVKIHSNDPRTRDKPLYAIASSLGAAELIGAIRTEGSNFGFERIVLDSPMLSFGSLYPTHKRGALRLLRTLFGMFPDAAAGLKPFYPRKRAPHRYPGMNDADHVLNQRYFNAFGPNHHALPYLHLDQLLATNASWLNRRNTRSILPPILVTAALEDPQVSVKENIALLRAHMNPDDAIRITRGHDSFSDRQDSHLVSDVQRFFADSAKESTRIYQGPDRVNAALQAIAAA